MLSIRNFTMREEQVLNLVAEGWTNREIAEKLHVTEETVKSHVKHMMTKAGTATRTELAVKCIREGVIK